MILKNLVFITIIIFKKKKSFPTSHVFQGLVVAYIYHKCYLVDKKKYLSFVILEVCTVTTYNFISTRLLTLTLSLIRTVSAQILPVDNMTKTNNVEL